MSNQPTTPEMQAVRVKDKPPKSTTLAALIAIVTTAYSLGFAACEDRREPVYGVDGVTQVIINGTPLTKKAAPDSALIISLLTSLVTGLYTIGERLLRHLDKATRRASEIGSVGLVLIAAALGAGTSPGCVTAERNGGTLSFQLRKDPQRPAPACLYRLAIDGDELHRGAIDECPAVPVCEEPQ